MSVTCYDKVLVYKRGRIFSVSVHHYNHHCLSLALDLLLPLSRQMSLSVACYRYRTSLITVAAGILDHEDKSTSVLRNVRSHLTERHNSEDLNLHKHRSEDLKSRKTHNNWLRSQDTLPFIWKPSVFEVSRRDVVLKHNKLGNVGRANYFLRVRVPTTNNQMRGFVTETG